MSTASLVFSGKGPGRRGHRRARPRRRDRARLHRAQPARLVAAPGPRRARSASSSRAACAWPSATPSPSPCSTAWPRCSRPCPPACCSSGSPRAPASPSCRSSRRSRSTPSSSRSAGPGDNPAVEHLAARGIPMFSTGVPSDRRITQVRIDERAAGVAIAEHVRSLGHRRVAHVAMPMLPTSTAGPVPDAEVQPGEANVPSVGRLLGFRDVFGADAPAVQTGDGSSFEGGTDRGPRPARRAASTSARPPSSPSRTSSRPASSSPRRSSACACPTTSASPASTASTCRGCRTGSRRWTSTAARRAASSARSCASGSTARDPAASPSRCELRVGTTTAPPR